MSHPVPEEGHQPAGPTEPPADEHPSELPDERDTPHGTDSRQQENAGTALDQPSDDAGGE